jgi:hypothetical protein
MVATANRRARSVLEMGLFSAMMKTLALTAPERSSVGVSHWETAD